MNRPAALAAWTCAALNAAAAAGMLLLLRPGLPPADVASRWQYIAGHPTAWTIGWSLWIAAGVSLTVTWFLVDRRAGWVNLAGHGPDFAALFYLILKFPSMSPGAYADDDRWTAILSGTLGNGAYTTAWLLAAWRAGLPRGLRLAAVPGIAAGTLLAVGSAVHSVPLMIGSTAALLPLFVAWMAAAGSFFWKKAP